MKKSFQPAGQIVLICIVIIVAFGAGTVMFSISSFKNTNAYIEQVTDMTSTGIINDISANMSASICTAKSMATSSFIVDWVEGEANNTSGRYTEKLYNYLKTYHEDNRYNFVFYISKSTNICYYQDGMCYKLSRKNLIDKQLYSFMDSDLKYQFTLNPFKSDNDSNKISLLTLYKLSAGKKTLGIMGVSINLSAMESSVLDLGNNYDVDIAFADTSGNIIISREYSIPEGSNIFDDGGLFYGKDIQLIPAESAVTRSWIGNPFDIDRKFCEIRYIKSFDWYLIVAGNGSGVAALHKKQLLLQLGLVLILLVFMLFIIITTIKNYRNKIVYLATMDELTKIMNRKSFMSKYERFVEQHLLDGAHIFIMDIDFFKNINDTLGHAKGDEALYFLATSLSSFVKDDGFIGRWGGDEFIGIFFPNVTNPVERIRNFSEWISSSNFGKSLHMTLSIGIAALLTDKPLNKSLERADVALYASKKNGRNCVTLYDEVETAKYSEEFIKFSE